MLMQNFKSASDLGITEAQFDGLRKTLVLLETGKLMHVDLNKTAIIEKEGSYTGHFNMSVWNTVTACGTACCIRGTAELVGNCKFNTSGTDNLNELFFARHSMTGERAKLWNEITPTQAATALRSYLTTGDARWDLAVA